MRPRLLVVDDDAAIRALVRRALADTVDVLEAQNGAEALEILLKGPTDLVLLDLAMPMMGGLETLRILRGHPGLQHVPVVVFSGNADRARVEEAIGLGITDCLAKPFSVAFLRQRFQQLADLLQRDSSIARPVAGLDLTPGSNVLLIDQSPVFRSLGGELLGRVCRVQTVDNEFTGLVASGRSVYDVVFLGLLVDWSEPEAVARRFRGAAPGHNPILVAVPPPAVLAKVQASHQFDAVVPRCLDRFEAEVAVAKCLRESTRQRFLFHPRSAWLEKYFADMTAPLSEGFDTELSIAAGPASQVAPRWIVATIELQGPALDQVFRLRCTHAAAVRLATKTTGHAPDEVSDRLIQELVGDLAGRLGRDLERRIAEAGFSCEASTPVTVDLGPSGVRPSEEIPRGLTACFHAHGADFVVVDLAPPADGRVRVFSNAAS